MILAVIATISTPFKPTNDLEVKIPVGRRIVTVLLFFFVGIYGGFIQAGVGFIIIALLPAINGLSLLKTNSVKVFVVLTFNLSAIAVFAWQGKIDWTYGLVLACGNATGAWLGTKWSLKIGEKWIKIVVVITVITMAIKLWIFDV